MTDTNAPAPGPLPDVPPGPKKDQKGANTTETPQDDGSQDGETTEEDED